MIHLGFAAVKDFNFFIWIKAVNDLGRTSKATKQYVNKPQNLNKQIYGDLLAYSYYIRFLQIR